MTNQSDEPSLSVPMRLALDALLAGEAAPPEAQAALSPSEQDEIAALARTAHLTRIALHAPQPSPDGEEASLAKAQAALATHPPLSPVASLENGGILQAWRDRLRRRNNGT